ncbi:MAG: hypothetical protein F6J97_17730 [Leptolyngbya sp. SIO4C1]|nr:hypothetical protein [Leptolyngbya sp. SIO4C1]
MSKRKILDADICVFLQAAATCSPDYPYPEAKLDFLSTGKVVLRRIAHTLGYAPGSYDLRINRAGIAVSGEITLHTDDLYVRSHNRIAGR